jgi:tetratricopeptide (TPR) repeat protein
VKTIRVVGVVCFCVVCVLPGVASAQEPDPFESLLASAQDAQARSDFQAAGEFYRQAVSLHPEIPELKANLGLMYYQTGRDEQAIEEFRQALRLRPSLFVPNLFLGLEYVKLKRFSEAIPYLKRAVLAKPTDAQAQLGLGQSYRRIGKSRLATAAYSQAAQSDPENADAWYHLGVSYLEQVEADARILLTQHRDSAYVQTLIAETFAEQHALIQAEEAYKKVLTFPKVPPNAHASYGFVLLNRRDLAGAERELNAELASNPGSLMAKLGLARLHVEQGGAAQAAKEIGEIWNADAGFLRANVSLFTTGPKRAELQSTLQERQASGDIPLDTVALFRDSTVGLAPAAGADVSPPGVAKTRVGDPAKMYATGNYRACSDALASRLQSLPPKDLHLLASCAYLTGNYLNALKAATKLDSNAVTKAEGLYWETKASQKLATEALARASAADSDSPKLHVLLGDIHRQRKNLSDAEQEYRKALRLRPEDTGALFGLSLALLAAGQNDEALSLAQAALEKNPDDAELNAVMGEILCARNEFSGAEPYLKKGLNTKPEYILHVHALLGKVYAHTNRTQQAITELKLALGDDKDGRLHYQIGRLYLKSGDRVSAKQAFEVSDRLRREGWTRAEVAMQQGEDNNEPQ